jgi:hypothetical protein
MTIICAITLIVPDLAGALRVYQSFGYSLLAQGNLTEADEVVQRDARFANCAYARLDLNSELNQILELVEYTNCVRHEPFALPGWSAIELLVCDLDVVREQVLQLALPIWGEPQALSFTENIRAMQVIGPANELIYFTEQLAPVDAWPLPQAQTQFDQCFVAILCSHQIELSVQFYAALLKQSKPAVIESRVIGLSRLGGLQPDALHSISAMPLTRGHWLEFDQSLRSDERRDGEVASGIFSISLRSDIPLEHHAEMSVGTLKSVNRACYFLIGPSREKINWYYEQGV